MSDHLFRNICGIALAGFVVASMGAARAESADHYLVEAESFLQPGGWVLDTQFIESMGSPYLLAHGLGEPVKDATTTVALRTGKYHVYVRTKDWVAKWNAPGAPGKFQLLIDGKPLEETFGAKGADWFWQDGGAVEIANPPAMSVNVKTVTLALHDLTGFDGRCDAIYFAKDAQDTPPNDAKTLVQWRKKTLGLPEKPEEAGTYDLVVVGGGYAGMGAAISAARMGLQSGADPGSRSARRQWVE